MVIITAYGSAANAVEAMKLGAVDFLEKPFDPKMIGILTEEILIRRQSESKGSFDDLMHLAELARQRNALLEARTYLKSAMVHGCGSTGAVLLAGKSLRSGRRSKSRRAILLHGGERLSYL